jgi:hypothetical protein
MGIGMEVSENRVGWKSQLGKFMDGKTPIFWSC